MDCNTNSFSSCLHIYYHPYERFLERTGNINSEKTHDLSLHKCCRQILQYDNPQDEIFILQFKCIFDEMKKKLQIKDSSQSSKELYNIIANLIEVKKLYLKNNSATPSMIPLITVFYYRNLSLSDIDSTIELLNRLDCLHLTIKTLKSMKTIRDDSYKA